MKKMFKQLSKRELLEKRIFNSSSNLIKESVERSVEAREEGRYEESIRYSNVIRDLITTLIDYQSRCLKSYASLIAEYYKHIDNPKGIKKLKRVVIKNYYYPTQGLLRTIEDIKLFQREVRAEQISNQEE